jgi:hypothetical protein
MKKNIFFRVITAIVFFFIVQPVISQVNNDAGLWENIYLEKKFTSKWNVHLNHEGRMNQNITNFYYAYADVGITYKFTKHIKVMADYVWLEKIPQKSSFWSIRHQGYAAIVFKQKIGSFAISDRTMAQVQYSDVYSSEKGMLPDYRLRNKLTVKYNNNSRYTYYIAAEIYYKVNSYYKVNLPQGEQVDRMRYFAGTFYEINKMNKVELYYLYENNFNINKPTNNFVIGIGFAHYFGSREIAGDYLPIDK